MPYLEAIAAPGGSGRRLLDETLTTLASRGYPHRRTVEGGEWNTLLAEGNTGGLFDLLGVTVVESAEDLGPFPKGLLPLLEEEEASEIIILVYAGDPGKLLSPDARKKIPLRKGEKVPFWADARKKWLLSFASSKKILLAEDAASLLVDMVEDPEELRGEVEKLGMYADGRSIDGEMVRALSFDEGRNSVLRFLDAFCAGRPSEVFSALEHLRKEPSVLPLLTALYNRLRPALYLGVFGSKRGAWVQKTFDVRDYALRMSREASALYSADAIRDFALGLLALSWTEKTGGAEGWWGFETLLLQCMTSGGKK
ncbi:MAG: hypothetical protein GX791_02975 [Synergistaceae bacterium]|nr:hypothetical protein [Synergistaceae bacterium]